MKDVRNVPLGQAVEPAIYFTTRQFPFSEVFIAVKAADGSVAQTAIRNALRKSDPQRADERDANLGSSASRRAPRRRDC